MTSLGSHSSVTDPQLFASDDALMLAPMLGNTQDFLTTQELYGWPRDLV